MRWILNGEIKTESENNNYKIIMESIEAYFRAFFAVTLLSVVSDVKDFIMIIIILSLINWVCGWLADRKVGKPYSTRKSFKAVGEMTVAFVALFVTALTVKLLEPDTDFKIVAQTLTGIFSLIYLRNTFRNLKIIQPDNDFVSIIYSITNLRYKGLKKKHLGGKHTEDGKQSNA